MCIRMEEPRRPISYVCSNGARDGFTGFYQAELDVLMYIGRLLVSVMQTYILLMYIGRVPWVSVVQNHISLMHVRRKKEPLGFCHAEPHITRAYWKEALDFCHTSLMYVRRVLWASLVQNHISMMFTGREL